MGDESITSNTETARDLNECAVYNERIVAFWVRHTLFYKKPSLQPSTKSFLSFGHILVLKVC